MVESPSAAAGAAEEARGVIGGLEAVRPAETGGFDAGTSITETGSSILEETPLDAAGRTGSGVVEETGSTAL
jgi:hypothetical protein